MNFGDLVLDRSVVISAWSKASSNHMATPSHRVPSITDIGDAQMHVVLLLRLGLVMALY